MTYDVDVILCRMVKENELISGEYYHVFSRTIFNIPEFKEARNAGRLRQSFLLSNSTKSSAAFDYLRNNNAATLEKAIKIANEGEKLVDISCYVIMPDHYHLLLTARRKNGIADFIRKSNISIAKYINIKKNRRGPLFESRFKSKRVDSNKYLLHLSVYIHLNPLDFIDGKAWRNNKMIGWPSKKERLIKYPWSSLRNYLESSFNDPLVSGADIIQEQFKGVKDYESFLREWSSGSLEKLSDLTMEE